MKPKRSFLILVCVFTLLVVFGWASSAHAQTDGPSGVDACSSCHEQLYYNYDVGKYYCQCKTKVSCTGCHGGNSETFIEDEAHLGMVANPLVNDAAVCRDCHHEETPNYVKKFAAIAGVHTIHPCPTYAVPLVAESVSSQPPPDSFLEVEGFQTWQKVSLGILAIAFLGMIFFGYRCWRADCLPKLPHP